MLTNDEMREALLEVHPLLASLTLTFWRMRLLVERKAGMVPLKLLILSVAHKKEGVSPGSSAAGSAWTFRASLA